MTICVSEGQVITRDKHDLSPQRVNSVGCWLHFRRAREEDGGEGGKSWRRGGGGRLLKQVIILSASAIGFERWQESITE